VARPQGPQCDSGAFELGTIGGKNLKITTNSIDLAWDGGTAQIGYTLLEYNTATSSGTLIHLPGAATSYSATVTNGVIYCYVLAPLDAIGILGLSDLLCAMAGQEAGAAIPRDFTLSLGGTSTATMTWTAPMGGADSYLLQRIPLNGNPPSAVPLSGGATSTTEPVAVPEGSCFQLVAFKGVAFGTSDVLCGIPGISTLSAGVAKRTAGDVMAEAAERLAGVSLPTAMPALQEPELP